MVSARELLIMAGGGGASLGLAAAVLDTSVSTPSDDQQYEQPASLEGEQARLEAEFHAKLNELRRLENEASSPAQQWAEGVLASGGALTSREMTTLSEIVNGQPGQVTGHSDYSGSSYVGGVASTTQSRSVLDHPSASRAWREQRDRTSTPSYGAAAASLGDSDSNSVGTTDVRTGQYYAPAGTGYVNPQNGTYYTPSGPSGVVDTRTGAFIHTAP